MIIKFGDNIKGGKNMKKTVYTLVILILCLIAQSVKLIAQEDEVIQFVQALQDGEIEKVKEFLNKGTDPNLEFHSSTPLMIAIWSGNYEIFKLLVDEGALVDKKVDKVDPLINMAASNGSNEICEYLLLTGVDINSKDREGKTPLMNAIYGKHPETANIFINKGADMNEQEINGWTALMFAAMQGDLESVSNLIEAGADVNLKTNDGDTPLKRAKLLDHLQIIEVLVAAGAQ